MKHLYILLSFLTLFFALKAQSVHGILNEMKAHAQAERDAAARSQNARTMSLQSNLASSNFEVKHYRCEWEINPAVKFIAGKVTATIAMTSSGNSVTFDLHRNMNVDSVRFRGANITFNHNTNHSLLLNLPVNLAAGTRDSVSIFYKGVPDASGMGSFATTLHAGVPVLWTLSQPYGSRDWWPCRNGLDDKADSIDIIMTCPAAYRNSANGKVMSDVVNAGKRVTWFKHRYPVASYLVAIACSNYVIDSYTVPVNGRNILFENWTYPESQIRFQAEAYGVINALKWFTEFYGDYPFADERYAQTQFSWGGGMEHQTNSFMGAANHILQAHELAHQWFGDKVTCGSWRDIWVNEGITSFNHWLYFERHDMPTFIGINNEYLETVTSENDGSVFVNDTSNIGRVFDWRLTYVKGAYVVHMLRRVLGDAVFFPAMRAIAEDPALRYGFATTADIKRILERSTGKNLTEFFKDWIYGQGHPSYKIKWAMNNNGWLNIQVEQKQSHSSVDFFEWPVQVRFKNATRDTTLLLDVQRNNQWFYARPGFVPDTVMVDPNLWTLSKNNSQQKMDVAPGADIINVYPNPVAVGPWYTTISNPTSGVYTLELLNTAGQTVWKQGANSNGYNLQLEIPNTLLAAGVYQLRISNGNRVLAVKRLVKG
jgi:aminopeptidase N